jgi:hypothetical protein
MMDPDLLVDTWFLLSPEQRISLEHQLERGDPRWDGLLPWSPESETQRVAPSSFEFDTNLYTKL